MSKRTISVTGYFFLLLLISWQCTSQVNGYIRGEGDVITEEISLDAMQGFNLGFAGDVVLTHGNAQKIVMEGQKNILDNIKRQVKNGVSFAIPTCCRNVL